MHQNPENAFRVLLVDDEPLILSAYQRTLRNTGVELHAANNPLQGLSILESTPIDVVVADYRMPEMNGDVFLEQIGQRWPNVVRILVTAYAEVTIVEEAVRRGGIFRFLTKPCEAEKLRGAVQDALTTSRNRRETERVSQQLKLDLHSYKRLFESSPDAMMIADLDGNLIVVNDAFIRQHGQDQISALQNRPQIFSNVTCESNTWEQIKQQLLEHGRWSGEIDHYGLRYALMTISLLNNDAGKPHAIAATEKDVTAQRKFEQQARAAQYEVIYALAKLAEYRDPETGAHLERMRRYCQIVAQQLSKDPQFSHIVTDEYVEAIFFSSPLHDIGKVGIPDSVLLKPGKLTPEEWRIMQTHAEIGAEVLAAAGDSLSHKSWLTMAKTIALQHHEKFDGAGYPHGIKGHDIDLSARIVALADAYDAITSRRVYKAALPHEEARKRIVESSGTHFDPDIVDAFLKAESEFIRVRNEFNDQEEERRINEGRHLGLAAGM